MWIYLQISPQHNLHQNSTINLQWIFQTSNNFNVNFFHRVFHNVNGNSTNIFNKFYQTSTKLKCEFLLYFSFVNDEIFNLFYLSCYIPRTHTIIIQYFVKKLPKKNQLKFTKTFANKKNFAFHYNENDIWTICGLLLSCFSSASLYYQIHIL